jgi:hypothetical protein
MLVEMGTLEQIEVNFLIVGHTHTNLDQYYSVLSTAIFNTDFIGSPLALWNLFQTAHSEGKISLRPVIQKQITVYYDMSKALTPYINKNIKFYQVPHVFRIKRVCGKAVMQYKLFSTNLEYLPLEPENIVDNNNQLIMENNIINKIKFSTFATVDGDENFYRHLGLNDSTPTTQVTEELITEKIDNIKSMLPFIKGIEKLAIDQHIKRNGDEETFGMGRKRYQSRNQDLTDIQSYMLKSSNKERGYIMWIDSLNNQLLPISEIVPEIIHDEQIVTISEQIKNKKGFESDETSSDDEDDLDNNIIVEEKNDKKMLDMKEDIKKQKVKVKKASSVSKLRAAIRSIVAAAKQILNNLKTGKVAFLPNCAEFDCKCIFSVCIINKSYINNIITINKRSFIFNLVNYTNRKRFLRET